MNNKLKVQLINHCKEKYISNEGRCGNIECDFYDHGCSCCCSLYLACECSIPKESKPKKIQYCKGCGYFGLENHPHCKQLKLKNISCWGMWYQYIETRYIGGCEQVFIPDSGCPENREYELYRLKNNGE